MNRPRDPRRAGIYKTMYTPSGFTIDAAKWRAATESGDLVGECRRNGCPGFLIADDDIPKYQPAGRRDYTARCLFCDAEMVAPGGRIAYSSASHSEAAAFWNGRLARLKEA